MHRCLIIQADMLLLTIINSLITGKKRAVFFILVCRGVSPEGLNLRIGGDNFYVRKNYD
jgi:hypothetical protein